jgi:diguanylate cyclase (GGDEF)-like protein
MVAMPDDISALFDVSVYVESMLGLLLLFTWVQNTEIKAAAWWGGANLLRAGSIALFGAFGRLPDVITIDLANVILLTSFAVTWTGARAFRGQKTNVVFVLAGAAVWLLAYRMPGIAGSIALRSVLSALIIATYVWLAAAELWRDKEDPLVSRIPACFLLFAHGALFLLRTPLALAMPRPAGAEPVFGSVWLTVLSSQALLFTIAIAFILMAMAKERTAFMHKAASLIDPLTGVWNRRGFLSEGDRRLETSSRNAEPAAVLFIDLDNFKAINDRCGHAFGDQVLRVFVATAKSVIRSTDFMGRLGGEEFAAVLHGADYDNALAIAERIRTAFAERAAVIDGVAVGATVSIGGVLHDGSQVAISELLGRADQALYLAKERGRNRVELMEDNRGFAIA